MKILQVNSVYKYGSTGRITENISSFIMKDVSNESFIAYGRGRELPTLNSRILKFGNKIEQMKHLLLTRIFDRHGFGSKKGTIQLINFIEEKNPDVILLHNIHGYYLNIKILFNFLSEKRIPIVWLFHDAWPISGHSAHFKLTKEGEIPQKNMSFKQRFEYPASFLIDQSRRNYLEKKQLFTSVDNMTIVAPSKWLSERISKSFFSSYSINTIHNGIDTNQFKVIDNQQVEKMAAFFKNKKVILGVASTWTDKKGLQVFNELADMISEEYQIIMIGINKKNKKKLNQKIYSIKRTENIEELVLYYNLAYTFVNPTFEDNFPTTNLEALACGTPVITFDTGGSKESITEKCGIVTKEKTALSIIEALDEMEKKAFRQVDCRYNGEKFSIENMLLKYQRLFSSIIKDEINES